MYENTYAYTAADGTCAYDESIASPALAASHTDVTPSDATAMKTAMVQQPLSISIEADQWCFQLYSSGVFNNTNCGTTLDHAVTAVGYGVESGQEYWLVKNSWGTGWGEAGYIKFAIVDGDGMCGCQMGPLYPTLV